MAEEEKKEEKGPQEAPQAAPEGEEFPAADIESGKLWAILSWIFLILGIVPVIQKENKFALYHGKQALFFFILWIALSIISGLLAVVCIGFIIALVGSIFLLVLQIMGLVYSIQGQYKPAPLLGPLGLQLFKSVQVEKK